MPELIAPEDVARWGARAGDEVRRRENERAGHTLCGNCGGTGNELYAMYRSCPECCGGVAMRYGELSRPRRGWAERRDQRTRKKLARAYSAPRDWNLEFRWRISRWFGIGHTFGAYEECRHCHAPASDIDFEVRRVRPFVIECTDREMCDEMRAEANR